jgi:hypothetical protein
MTVRREAGAAVLAVSSVILLVTFARAQEDDRVACWNGALDACEAGLGEHPEDPHWLAAASVAYARAGEWDRSIALQEQQGRVLQELALVYFSVLGVAEEEMDAGNYPLAVEAYTYLHDHSGDFALLTEIKATGGDPGGIDEPTREAISAAIADMHVLVLENRGLSRILNGEADEGIADLRAALEYGSLRETPRLLHRRGIADESGSPFFIRAIDSELEGILRAVAAAQFQ